MKAIDFEQQNVIFAENQEEYLPLPAYIQNNGLVTFCLELDEWEMEQVENTRILKITVLTFGRPVQPIRVTTVGPAFPVTPKGQFHCNPKSWGEGPESPATLEIEMLEIGDLKETKTIWITTSTFGAPLQPISMTLNS